MASIAVSVPADTALAFDDQEEPAESILGCASGSSSDFAAALGASSDSDPSACLDVLADSSSDAAANSHSHSLALAMLVDLGGSGGQDSS